jgi:hypothetical protein
MNIKKILLSLGGIVIIGLAIVIGIVYFLFSIPKAAKKTLIEDSIAFSTQPPSDYLKLLSSQNLVSEGSFSSNKRNPVSEFSYNNLYNIWVYKFPDIYRDPIKNVVKETYSSTDLTTFSRYINVVNDSVNRNDKPISILYVSGHLDKLTNIDLNLYGKDYRTIEKDDTIAYYALKLNNFSITNRLNGSNIIYGVANNKLKYKVPVEIMLFKKLNGIYLIIMTVKGRYMELNQGLLHKLVFKK